MNVYLFGFYRAKQTMRKYIEYAAEFHFKMTASQLCNGPCLHLTVSTFDRVYICYFGLPTTERSKFCENEFIKVLTLQ